jgi:hypothetical protein
MRLDTLASKFDDYLYESRWLFLSTRTDAIIFLFISICCFLTLFVYLTIDPTSDILKGYSSKKRVTPIDLLKGVDQFKSDEINILLLGGSTSRELTGSNRFFSEKLTMLCGKKVNYFNAGSSSQSYVASRTLYSEYQKNNVDMIIIGMNYYRYIIIPDRHKYDMMNNGQVVPIPYNLFFEEYPFAQALPAILPPYLDTKLRYLLRKNKIKIGSDKRHVDTSDYMAFHNKYKGTARSFETKQEIARRFMVTRYPDYVQFSSFAAKRWQSFSNFAQSNGSKIMFLALPEDPSFGEVYKQFDSVFRRHLDQHQDQGTIVIDWRKKDLGLLPLDFYDQQHFLSSGRKKISTPLANIVVNNIPECSR